MGMDKGGIWVTYIGHEVLGMEQPGRRNKGRTKRRYMDVVRKDMEAVGMTVEEVEHGGKWRDRICCDDPLK